MIRLMARGINRQLPAGYAVLLFLVFAGWQGRAAETNQATVRVPESLSRSNSTSAILSSPRPGRSKSAADPRIDVIQRHGLEYRGVLVQVRRAPPPWQLINPLAPARYGPFNSASAQRQPWLFTDPLHHEPQLTLISVSR